MQTVAVFVDVQNIYYTTRQAHHCHFDYNQFWSKISHNRKVIHAFAYAIQRNDSKQKQFQNILRGIGFEVKLKPFIQRQDGSTKGDWDVGIAIDIMEIAEQVDVIILASGDGDFDLLVDKIKDKFGTTVEVYGVTALSATSLIEAASIFIPIQGDLLLP